MGRARRYYGHKVNAKNSDQPFSAVIKDLKQRGLWKDILVVCGSEFGRTPVREVGGGGGNLKKGRDHNPFGFTATILHLMGIDHTKLTYCYSGRDFRLTDVSGKVLHELLA